MLYLLVQVNEGVKCVIPERIMSMEPTNQFFDLFDAITLGQYDGREVKVFIRQEKFEGWREVDNGLYGDLAMLEVLGFRQVKFCLAPNINLNIPDLAQDGPNAFDILMTNSRQLLLPRHCTENNNFNKLYNEIIVLFQAHEVGWTCGSHETISKEFINRLTSALWYIDPHLSTLNAHSYHLPALFKQLETYQNGESYNKYYHTSHHKKNPLSQQKLAQLASSLELSISQPWASDYLIATAASMNEIHYSDKSSRSPENDSTMYRIGACENNKLKDDYIELDVFLFEKPCYEHVNIQEFLPSNVMKQYRYIKELQLTFLIGVYRLVFESLL
ncbi:9245_t:CDS:2 [Cetraspora pellucida]|uniref:9245_t:CDS:1 n=1 Tax=Cetraspora pellucida TaxID=1433469 RepID=A0ACA9LV34_9GLOM|nr:9245_t:CDS:2 [Cetraspora pellucida]